MQLNEDPDSNQQIRIPDSNQQMRTKMRSVVAPAIAERYSGGKSHFSKRHSSLVIPLMRDIFGGGPFLDYTNQCIAMINHHTLEHRSGRGCPSRFSWGPTGGGRWVHFPPFQVESVHEGAKGDLRKIRPTFSQN